MAWIERHWERVTPVSAALFPLSLLFGERRCSSVNAWIAAVVARPSSKARSV